MFRTGKHGFVYSIKKGKPNIAVSVEVINDLQQAALAAKKSVVATLDAFKEIEKELGYIQVTGKRLLLKRLDDMHRKEARRSLAKAAKEAALIVQKSMREKVPVRKGRLKRGIMVRVSRSKHRKAKQYLIGPGQNVFYGRFQELGTINQPAQPFIRPAFEETIKPMKQKAGMIFFSEFKKEILK